MYSLEEPEITSCRTQYATWLYSIFPSNLYLSVFSTSMTVLDMVIIASKVSPLNCTKSENALPGDIKIILRGHTLKMKTLLHQRTVLYFIFSKSFLMAYKRKQKYWGIFQMIADELNFMNVFFCFCHIILLKI